jgi:hypothetical protein
MPRPRKPAPPSDPPKFQLMPLAHAIEVMRQRGFTGSSATPYSWIRLNRRSMFDQWGMEPHIEIPNSIVMKVYTDWPPADAKAATQTNEEKSEVIA